MPDIVVTIDEDGLRIDGVLPEGYRLIVHNHTGDPDVYSYAQELDDCRYHGALPDTGTDNLGDGVHCFEYTEP